MKYFDSVRLDLPYAQALSRVRDALKEQGFGIITEIDMRATMQEKLGEEIEDYVILGACNPGLAFRALGVDRSLGLLLPCNVVVRADGEGSVVEMLDPQTMVDIPEREDLRPVANEAGTLLSAALASLSASGSTAPA